jgi:hypothetical protein
MRGRIIKLVLFAAVSVVMLQGATAWASSPATPGSVSASIGVNSFGTIAVDDANQHVFVSAPSEGEVQVYDFSGNLVTTISGIAGAYGMVIHGTTLYVAESTTGDIEAINLSTFADEGHIATGLVDPRWLVYAGGELWTEEDPAVDDDQTDQLASVTLAGTVTAFTWGDGNGEGLDLASSPASPNTLYVAEERVSSGPLFEFDVSSGSPVLEASNPDPGGIEGFAVSPDGTRVIPAAAATTNGSLEELSSSTLTADGVIYPSDPSPSAVAVSPADGGIVATGTTNGGSETEIRVFPIGSPNAIFTASTDSPGASNAVEAHGLALSADGSRMFAVTSYWDGTGSYNLRLWTFDLNATTSTTTLSANPISVNSGQTVTLNATVAPTDGNGTVTFSSIDGAISGCGAVTLSSSPSGETATCTTTSLPSGSDTVTAEYGNNLSYSASIASTQVNVAAAWSPDHIWTGASTSEDWSSGANWAGNSPPAPGGSGAAGTVGTLSFPGLASGACSGNLPTVSCYDSVNDLSGLSANGLDINSGYSISGNPITLGAAGLTIPSPSGDGEPPSLSLPITLGAPQTWGVDQGPVVFNDQISGNQSLSLNFNDGSIEPSSSMEVGRLGGAGEGGFYLDGDTAVNSTDLNLVQLAGGAGVEADQTGNAIGPLELDQNGWLSLGGIDNGGAELAVNGTLSLYSAELDMAVDSAGTTAGLDYSKLTAAGNVTLLGTELDVSQGVDVNGDCADLHPGDALTLISTSGGTINGTFSNYGNGASVDIADECNGADEDATGRLTYSSNAVTLTITNAGDAGDVPVELAGPSITGTAEEGQTLQLNPGSWQGQTSLAYSWWDCDTDDCTQIPGATSSTFVPTSAQLGDQIAATVTATGPGGSNFDSTNNTDAVTAEPVPAATAAPTVRGSTAVGDGLTATTGVWSNSPTSYTYQWERCPTAGSINCAAITGATTGSYTLTSQDVGTTIEIRITAANYGGTGSTATSAPTAVVTGPTSTAQPPPSPPKVSVTSVKSALKQIVAPTGKAATPAELLKLHGYVFKFPAPAGGHLNVTWTVKIKRKTVILARASMNIASAHSVKVKVSLTAAGKSVLKRYSDLKVTAKTSFKPSGLSQVNRSGSFTLRKKGSSSRSRRLVRGVSPAHPRGLRRALGAAGSRSAFTRRS